MRNLRIFTNCRVLKDYELVNEDLCVCDGKIIDKPSALDTFNIETFDCCNKIISPGFIDIQINGCFGKDFTADPDIQGSISYTRKRLLETGCTAFCPTVITSKLETYEKILPSVCIEESCPTKGAAVLGLHLEGPLISEKYRGCHQIENLRNMEEFDVNLDGKNVIRKVYGDDLSAVSIVTLDAAAPNIAKVVTELSSQGIIVNIGHTSATYEQAESIIIAGASGVTHLYNAQPPFTATDPAVIGTIIDENRGLRVLRKLPFSLKRTDEIPCETVDQLYYGIIADSIHISPQGLKVAHGLNSNGLCLITDAIAAMGLGEGTSHIADIEVEVTKVNGALKAVKVGTDVLAGVAASIDDCVRLFVKATNIELARALTYASLHPARYLGIHNFKGKLEAGYDADFIIIDDEVKVYQTWLKGDLAFKL